MFVTMFVTTVIWYGMLIMIFYEDDMSDKSYTILNTTL